MRNKESVAVFRQSLGDFTCPVTLGKDMPSFGLHRYKQGLRFVPGDDEGFTLRGDRRRLVYKGRRRSHRFTILGDTAFEYDCILEKEPETNVISLRMEGAENFDFFRQPDFVDEPFLKGSYAVYKKVTLVGEGTGKLCHIHRPEIIDARGRRCWGDLAVVGNELRITIPENWLAEAKYPVIVDPTIGTTTVGSQYKLNSYNTPFECQMPVNRFLVSETINAGNCTAYVYTNQDDPDAGGRPVVYNDFQSLPNTLKTSNESLLDFRVKSGKPAGWRTATFNYKTQTLSGNYIWFGVFVEYFWYPRFDYGQICYLESCYDSIPTKYPIYSANLYEDRKLSMYFVKEPINYVKTLTQGVSLSDRRKKNTIFQHKTNQTIQIEERTKSKNEINRMLQEISAPYDGNSFLFSLIRKIQEEIKITERLSCLKIYILKLIESTGIVSKVIADVPIYILRKIQERIYLTDTIQHLKALIRGLKDNLSVGSEVKKGWVHFRKLGDTVQAAGTVFRGLFLFVRIVTGAFVRDYFFNRFLKAKQELPIKSKIVRDILQDSRIKIFKGQTALRIRVKTYCDLEGIQSAVIKYTKPNGKTGQFAAAVEDTEKGVIFHECIEGEIDVSGWWAFWAFVTFADGRTAPGEAVKVYVWREGR
jgi:hypothetical protein